MAASNLNLGKASGGVLNIQPADGTTTTSLVLPASGTVVATDANGNLGLGGTASAFGGYTSVTLDNATNGGIYNIKVNGTETARLQAYSGIFNIAAKGATTNLTFEANGAERMRVDANGNVGIGVTPYNWNSASQKVIDLGSYGAIAASTAGAMRVTQNAVLNSSNQWIYKNNGTALLYEQDTGHVWKNTSSGINGNAITWTNAMTLDAGGNLGIGIAPAPNGFSGKSLQLQSYFLTSDVNSHYQVNNAYESSGWRYKNSKYATLYAQDSATGSHIWHTASSGTAGSTISWTNVMTLNASNGLNLNTSYAGSYPAVTMFGNASNNYVQILGRNAANNDIVFNSTVGGVIKAAILSNGNFQSATNSYGSTSDAKLKENVVETSDKLDKLMNVRVVNFNYIGDDQKQIGVIAQEIEKIFPGIVYETKDTEQVEVTKTRDITDEEGNVATEEYTETETVETGEVTKNVKYSVIYMMMLKGLQEMRAEYTAEINDLKSRIEILEGAK